MTRPGLKRLRLAIKSFTRTYPERVDELAELTGSIDAYEEALAELEKFPDGPVPVADQKTFAKLGRKIDSAIGRFSRKQYQVIVDTNLDLDSAVGVLTKSARSMNLANQFVSQVRLLRLDELQMIEASEPTARYEALRATFLKTSEDFEVLSKELTTDQTKDKILEIGSALEKYSAQLEATNQALGEQQAKRAEVEEIVNAAVENARGFEASLASARSTEGNLAQQSIQIGAALAIFLGIIVAWLLVRSISRPIRSLTEAMTRLADNDLETDVPNTSHRDEIGGMAAALQVFKQQAIDKREIEKSAEIRNIRNNRIRAAVEASDSAILILNRTDETIFANPRAISLFNEHIEDTMTVLPDFSDADPTSIKLLNLFNNSRDIQDRLQNLETVFKCEELMGNRLLSYSISAVRDEVEGRIGTVVELRDLTDERKAEADLGVVVKAAAAGDFSQRLALSETEGMIAVVGQSVNDFCSSVDNAMTDLSQVLGGLSGGDLSARVADNYQGVLESVKNDANTTAEKLTEIVGSIQRLSVELSGIASEISTATSALSNGSATQMQRVQDTTQSMADLANIVEASAETANQARSVAEDANKVAYDGKGVVGSAVQAMHEIEKSSSEIADIISIIDEIAFQTNLLALNAAVESARAGEAGKGFGLVAAEVRSLAQRTTESAKQINALVTDSQQRVKDGVELVNRTGSTLDQIVGKVEELNEMFTNINQATADQTDGLSEVDAAIRGMEDSIKTNSATVNHTSQTSVQLVEISETMAKQVAFFR